MPSSKQQSINTSVIVSQGFQKLHGELEPAFSRLLIELRRSDHHHSNAEIAQGSLSRLRSYVQLRGSLQENQEQKDELEEELIFQIRLRLLLFEELDLAFANVYQKWALSHLPKKRRKNEKLKTPQTFLVDDLVRIFSLVSLHLPNTTNSDLFSLTTTTSQRLRQPLLDALEIGPIPKQQQGPLQSHKKRKRNPAALPSSSSNYSREQSSFPTAVSAPPPTKRPANQPFEAIRTKNPLIANHQRYVGSHFTSKATIFSQVVKRTAQTTPRTTVTAATKENKRPTTKKIRESPRRKVRFNSSSASIVAAAFRSAKGS